MSFYRSEDGQSVVHMHIRRTKAVPLALACRAPRLEGDNPTLGELCGRISTKLCDGPAGQDLGGRHLSCDMPICPHHAAHVAGKNLDYCPRHATLATQPPLQP